MLQYSYVETHRKYYARNLQLQENTTANHTINAYRLLLLLLDYLFVI